MKKTSYEKTTIIYFLVFITYVLEITSVILLCINKIYSYQKLSGIVINKNHILIMADGYERKLLYQTKKIYIDNQNITFEIVEDKKTTLTSNKKEYSEIIMKVKYQNDYKENDVITLSIKNKKYRLIEMFKIIIEGD